MNEDKSAKYHRIKRRTSVLAAAWSTALLVALVTTGGSVWLRDMAGALTTTRSLVVLLCIAAIWAVHELGALPLAFYSGYLVEHRYGLSRQTPTQWLQDHAKGTALGLVLALVLGWLVYWTMWTWPDWWWLAAGVLFSALLVVFANLAPVILLPLFFRFTPLEVPTLRERLERLAERAGARVVGVFRWDLGEKTTKANAALTGLGGTRRILIADTMLATYSEDEIEVVLAHELAHHVHRDIWTGLAYETGLMLVGFLAAHLLLVTGGPFIGITAVGDPAGLPLVLLAAGGVSLMLMPLALALSRSHERRADRFALDLTRNPEAFTSAMKRLGAQNLAEEQPSRLVQWLFYSHPPLPERLKAAREWSAPPALGR